MNTQRLFIAITIPEHLRLSLMSAQHRLQRELANYPLRWVRPEGIHLTIKFLGETEASRITAIVASLKQISVRHASFELSIGGLGMFPNAKRPSVLWIGVNDETHRLQRLVADVDEAMAKLGWQREKQPFRGHLTLARVKKYAGKRERLNLGKAVLALDDYARLGSLPVSRLTIMRSRLDPGGAVYSEIATIDLA